MSDSDFPNKTLQAQGESLSGSSGADSGSLSPVKRALQEIRELRLKLKVAEAAVATRNSLIAIVGAGMRYPGGIRDIESLWELLASGKDAITEVPRDRWDWRQYFDIDPESKGAMYAVHGGFLDAIDTFDAELFGISPREAAMLDPQHRLLHEVTWHALEHAGISPSGLRESSYGQGSCTRTGVFVGLSNVDYYRAAFSDDDRIDAYAASGNSPSMAAGRLAYTLGVHGPAMTIDTSCSSSLIAVHLAVQSLRAGECDLALAGGVNLILGPQAHIAFSRAHMLAPDGHCKTFDASADGYVRSEGCGVIVLKRVQDALKNGDRILAVIRGSATNHDGRSGGLTAPSSQAQAALIRDAFANAGVGIDAVQMIEAHGTGTSLGDPIEMEALSQVFRSRARHAGPVSVGSIKTNLGHTEAASGVAGLLKVVASLQHQAIAGNLHFKRPSPFIPWSEIPVSVPTETTEWRLEAGQSRRVAGVSSFGFSGSNAHVVIEEWVDHRDPETTAQAKPAIATVSARSAPGLKKALKELDAFLESNPNVQLADICGTLSRGRAHFAYRMAWAIESREELLLRLRQMEEGRVLSGKSISTGLSLCFLFTGQGSEYAGMGVELYSRSKVFAQAIDLLEAGLGDSLGVRIPAIWANDNDELSRASLAQPAIFAYGWALSQLWRSWGVSPHMVLGHSLGEYIAATVAGVMAPREAIQLVAARGRLTEELADPGGMIAVAVSPGHASALLQAYPDLSIAAVNGASSVVISGTLNPLKRLEEELNVSNLRYKRLRTTHGFHSSALDAMLNEYESEAGRITFQTPDIRWISNVTGALASQDHAVDAGYWRRHLRQTVRFSESLATIQDSHEEDGPIVYLEIGAQPQLLALCGENGIPSERAVASIRKGGKEGEWFKIHHAAAQLYCCGLKLNWQAIQQQGTFQTVTLPCYAFDRQHYWWNDREAVEESHVKDVADAITEQSHLVPIGLDALHLKSRMSALNYWAKAVMMSNLQAMCFSVAGLPDEPRVVSTEILVKRYGLAPNQVRRLERWIQWLSEDGDLSVCGEPSERTFLLHSTVDASAVAWEKLEKVLEREESFKEYLISCAANLPGVLRGEIDLTADASRTEGAKPVAVFFEESPVESYLNRIVASAVCARARGGATTSMGYARRLRVLEIGTGPTATTDGILKSLSPHDVQYSIGWVFGTSRAPMARSLHGHSLGSIRIDLDREEDSLAAECRYDVAVMSDALLRNRDIRAALCRVYRVLQPGGMLVLLEATTQMAWSDVCTEAAEGLGQPRRSFASGSSSMCLDRWIEELDHAGFEQGNAVPTSTQPTYDLGMQVIVAHRPQSLQPSAPPDAVNEKTLVDSLKGQKKVDEQLPGNPLPTFPQGKRTIEELELVVQHETADILGLRGGELPDRQIPLADLGLDSLMAVSLRNRIQHLFGHTLPPTFAFEYPTIAKMAAALDLQIWGSAEAGRALVESQLEFRPDAWQPLLNNEERDEIHI